MACPCCGAKYKDAVVDRFEEYPREASQGREMDRTYGHGHWGRTAGVLGVSKKSRKTCDG